mmetsp:Transcript_22254/g.72140  ORF Transcript_22254/g.72140 Transcript_22254/m.72140 type:complete len:98 (-) Transcript_22254:1176-1469(-)
MPTERPFSFSVHVWRSFGLIMSSSAEAAAHTLSESSHKAARTPITTVFHEVFLQGVSGPRSEQALCLCIGGDDPEKLQSLVNLRLELVHALLQRFHR